MISYIDSGEGPMNPYQFDQWLEEKDRSADTSGEQWFTLHLGNRAAYFRADIGNGEGGLFDRLDRESHLIHPGDPYIEIAGKEFNVADGDQKVRDAMLSGEQSISYVIHNLPDHSDFPVRQIRYTGNHPGGIIDYMTALPDIYANQTAEDLKPYFTRQKAILDQLPIKPVESSYGHVNRLTAMWSCRMVRSFPQKILRVNLRGSSGNPIRKDLILSFTILSHRGF